MEVIYGWYLSHQDAIAENSPIPSGSPRRVSPCPECYYCPECADTVVTVSVNVQTEEEEEELDDDDVVDIFEGMQTTAV